MVKKIKVTKVFLIQINLMKVSSLIKKLILLIKYFIFLKYSLLTKFYTFKTKNLNNSLKISLISIEKD